MSVDRSPKYLSYEEPRPWILPGSLQWRRRTIRGVWEHSGRWRFIFALSLWTMGTLLWFGPFGGGISRHVTSYFGEHPAVLASVIWGAAVICYAVTFLRKTAVDGPSKRLYCFSSPIRTGSPGGLLGSAMTETASSTPFLRPGPGLNAQYESLINGNVDETHRRD